MNRSSLLQPVIWTSAAIGLAGGVAGSFSLPPFGFWPLGPLGIAIFLLAVEDHGIGQRTFTGFCFGLGMFVPGLWWAQHFNWYGALLLMVIEAAFFAGAGALLTPHRGRTFSAIGALVLAEIARDSWPLGGLPIGGLPLGQAGSPLFDIARIAGPFGLMMAVVIAGAGVRVLVTAMAARNTSGLDVGVRFGVSVLLLGLVILAAIIGAVAPSGGSPLRTERVAAVQGGGKRGTSQEQVDPASVTAAHVRELARTPTATTLTILPEDVVGLLRPLRGSWQNIALSSAAAKLSTTLVAGVTSPVGSTQFLNFAAVYGPSGRLLGTLEKVHRVPFGEYVPVRSLVSNVADLSGVPRDAIVGTGHEAISTPAGRLGILISFEVFFSSRGSDVIDHGAQLLIVPTNTTSYATSQMPAQEIAAAQLQAVEFGRDLIQASPTGFSAIINRRGDILARSPLSVPTLVTGSVTLYGGRTLYATFGDWPVIALALALVLVGQVRARTTAQS
jgi:apolipoprotein N-acyltransferase